MKLIAAIRFFTNFVLSSFLIVLSLMFESFDGLT